LAALAERASASGDWWKENATPETPDLVLPGRVLAALADAGIETVEQLKAAGPQKIRGLDKIGPQAFEQIVALLRALDREANGGGGAQPQKREGAAHVERETAAAAHH
jgi:hypothetical protein